METKMKKAKKTKVVKQRKLNHGKILYGNLRDLKELINDKEEYRLR